MALCVHDFPQTQFFCSVQVKSEGRGGEQLCVWRVPWDDALLIVELYILVAELGGAAVGIYLSIFTEA